MENTLTATTPEKQIKKYTIQEFWESLYFQCHDSDDNYDGFLHIVSDINGTEIKIRIKDIVREASKAKERG